MTIDQALSLLAQLAAQYKGTLEEHNSLQEALRVVSDTVQTNQKSK